MFLKFIEILQETPSLLGCSVALFGTSTNLYQTEFHEQVQILLKKVKAEVPQVHNPRLASAVLRDLNNVSGYLNPTAILSLVLSHVSPQIAQT